MTKIVLEKLVNEILDYTQLKIDEIKNRNILNNEHFGKMIGATTAAWVLSYLQAFPNENRLDAFEQLSFYIKKHMYSEE